MKILNGAELAGFIKERQARQVRGLRQAHGVYPKLAVIVSTDNPVIDTYVRLKQVYGRDILIEVERIVASAETILEEIERCNEDPTVHGIIVQLPVAAGIDTEKAVNAVRPEKDVDGLGSDQFFTPATPMAIDWLLAGYNVSLKNQSIVLVGNGRLVGAPLAKLWQMAGLDVQVVDDQTSKDELSSLLQTASIVVSATGVPGLITSSMLAPSAVVVDAGTAVEEGKIVGDLASDVRERTDLTVTPLKGGVGPLTIAALFDNVIRAAERTSQAS